MKTRLIISVASENRCGEREECFRDDLNEDNVARHSLSTTYNGVTYQVGDVGCRDAETGRDNGSEAGSRRTMSGGVHLSTLHVHHQEANGDKHLTHHQHSQRDPWALVCRGPIK